MSTITHGEIADALGSAVRWLERRQSPQGQFRAVASPTPDLSRALYSDSCVFVTALVAHGLSFVRSGTAEAVRDRCFAFLLSEMSADGLWRYWTAGSGMDIQPDADDTSMCSFVLRDHRPDIRALNEARLLGNRERGGLFQTWFAAENEPNDVDTVVNANVLLYLGETAPTRPVASALARVIREGRAAETSWYYPDPMALLHAVARAGAHGVTTLAACRDDVFAAVEKRRRPDGSFGDDLATALGLAALAALRCDDEALTGPAAAWLLRAQSKEGGWARCAFYTGPEAPAPRSIWFGSEDLTTATAIEALALLARARG